MKSTNGNSTTDTASPVGCAHCGLPVGTGLSEWAVSSAGEVFCCNGCSVAHGALRAAGLDETYYRLVGMTPSASRQPVPAVSDTITRAYLESPEFITEHGRRNEDGSCTVAFHVSGMHCAACSWLVDQVLAAEDGVVGVDVDLPRASVVVRIDPEAASLSRLARRLASFGYELHPLEARNPESAAERSLLIRVGVCWAIAGNVMLLAFTFYSGLDQGLHPNLALAARWSSLALTFAALFVGGSVFFKRALASTMAALRTRSPLRLHMDVPISLGIGVGFVASATNTASGGGEIWFDSISVLIAALLTARWLQTRGQQKARDASDRLFALIPRITRRVMADGSEEFVAVRDVGVGDLLRVETGENVPTDGQIVSGRSHFNQAALTGESRPVPLGPGDAALAGSINLGSTVVVTASTTGAGSELGQMLQWLDRNRSRKASVVLMADRIAGWFVLAVVLLAATTALVGYRMFPGDVVSRVVALLVIACPCALGMATPLAMVTARGRSARNGSLIKDDASIETLARIDTVVLDKTGTLTTGKLNLTDVFGDASVLEKVAVLERHSRHPIATAIVDLGHTSAREKARAREVREQWGLGIEGFVDDAKLLVGNPAWIAGQAQDPGGFAVVSDAVAAKGDTPVAIAVNGEWTAVLAFGDLVRPDARSTVDSIRRLGKRVFLLSGDHPEVTRLVGEQLGLPRENIYGGAMPRDKERFVVELRKTSRIAMVGDGVNDATAMRAADIGIALGSQNAPAVVAADVLVNNDRLASIDALIDLSNNTRRVIRANLTFSVLYNFVGALAAMFGYVTPLVAAVAMPVSSLVVVSSSLLINYSRRMR